MKPTSKSCREHLEKMSRYVDGELDAAERRAIARHIRLCTCCQHFAESLRRTVDACRAARKRRLPADVRARARARVEELLAEGLAAEEVERTPRRGRPARKGGGVACATPPGRIRP